MGKALSLCASDHWTDALCPRHSARPSARPCAHTSSHHCPARRPLAVQKLPPPPGKPLGPTLCHCGPLLRSDGRCLREVMRVWLSETLRPARGAASWEREDQTRTRKQSRPLMPFSPAAVTKYLVTGEMAEHRQPGHEELGRRALRRPPAGAPSPRILAGPVRARSACDHKASICLQHADGHLAPKSAACTDNTHSFRQK